MKVATAFLVTVFLFAFLAGCAVEQPPAEPQEEMQQEVPTPELTVVVEDTPEEPEEESEEVVEVDIRITEDAISPDVIEVTKGTLVKLNVINMRTNASDTRFIMDWYLVDEQFDQGSGAHVSFVADKVGNFEYGDTSDKSVLHGLLIVKE